MVLPGPTAQHSEAEAHVTAFRPGLYGRSTLAEVTTAHEVPSHRSVSVCRLALPTAQHAAPDKHVTSLSEPPTSGKVTIVHEVPSQRSTSVRSILLTLPTAQHSDADVHVTRLSEAPVAGLGEVTSVQNSPSQRATSD